MQVIAFYICNRTLWKSETIVGHPLLNITLTLAIALSVGIAGYHLIEVPAKENYEPSAQRKQKLNRQRFFRVWF